MKKLFSLLAAGALLVSCCLFAACHKPDDGLPKVQKGDFPVTIGDVTVAIRPTHAVVLTPSLADIVTDLGYTALLAGRADECDNPAVAALPTVGPGLNPDTQALYSAGVDLVLAQQPLPDSVTAWLTASGVPLVTLPPATDGASLEALYVGVAKALGGELSGGAAGETLFGSFVSAVQALGSSEAQSPQGSVLMQLDYGFVATGDSFDGWLLRTVGLTNVAENGVGFTAPADMAAPDKVLTPTSEQQRLLACQSTRSLAALAEILAGKGSTDSTVTDSTESAFTGATASYSE
ncbi:MAG: hypothetical protein FWF49_02255 [Oscillospiraceae bacterium]|nr:hypothetical protein [Oscillospiraceae bacterium]